MPNRSTGHSFGPLAAGAALGLFAGLALPAARKALVQGPALAAGDWVKALTAEHRMVEQAFHQLLATTDEEVLRREMLLTKIAYALTKHAIEEENVIYPALAENARADQAHHFAEEHAEVKAHIYELRRMEASDPRWLIEARALWTQLKAHMREEEEEVFPAFHDALPPEENARLTRMLTWEGFKVA